MFINEAPPKSEIESHIGTKARMQSLATLVCLWFFTQFVGLFSPPLLDDVDGIHMEAVKEMASRHNYVTLYVDGIRYLDKPPLPYWLGTIGIHVFGVHDWSVRIVLAISVLALTLYLYQIGRTWFSERAGFYSGCVIATALGPYIFTRFFIPDVMVALWMTIAADLILRMVRNIETKGKATWLNAICFGLIGTAAVLTKGLIGIVFPLGLLLLYLFIIRRSEYIGKIRPVAASLVFLITALPWHILAAIQNRASGQSRGWVWFYFVNEQIDRYLNRRIPRDYDKVPLLIFWLLTIVWLMPWGIFLIGALKRWCSTNRPLLQPGPRLLFVLWAVVVIGFFTFSTRQEYYTLPAIPALALIVGVYLSEHDDCGPTHDSTDVCVSSGVLFFGGLCIALLCLYLAIASHAPHHGAELYQELNKHPQDYRLSFGHFFDLTTAAFWFFRLPLIGMAISMFFMTGISFWLRIKKMPFASNLALAIGMCAIFACVHQGLRTFYPIIGSQPLAVAIRQQWESGASVVLDGEYSKGSSINFYLNEPVYMLNGRINNLWYGSLYADAPHRFESYESFLRLWQGPSRVFFVTYDIKRTEEWKLLHGGEVVASLAGKYVLMNH